MVNEINRFALNALTTICGFFLCLFVTTACQEASQNSKKVSSEKFVSISKESPSILVEASYAGNDNFIGSRINGYHSSNLLISKEAALALKCAEQSVRTQGYGLKVFDAYRPQKAVNHFVAWAKDLDDTLNKSAYYPNVAKPELFSQGYIAEKSGHSRGSTIDLTLFSLADSSELDMGTPFDFFGIESHPASKLISDEQSANRMILRKAMEACGFAPLETEWWHFYLTVEPYPETYFDFDIE